MATLIDTSYFFGDLMIPQKSQSTVVSGLQVLIDKYEPELLTTLLGYELYKYFKAGIAADPITQIYKDIRDGKEYTNSYGDLDKWPGLIFSNGTMKKSLIASYVYYWYLRNEETVTTGSGEKKDKNAGSINVSAGVKAVRAWNEMVNWNKQLVEFLRVHSDIYPSFDSWDWTRSARAGLLSPINTFGL